MKMELVQQRGLKIKKEKGLGHKGSCFTLILSLIRVLYYFTWLEMVSQSCIAYNYTFQLYIHMYIHIYTLIHCACIFLKYDCT
jgi:hypothetical protein